VEFLLLGKTWVLILSVAFDTLQSAVAQDADIVIIDKDVYNKK
jgi:hypothetical protein